MSLRTATTAIALAFSGPASAQVVPGDLLLNVWGGDVDVIHAAPDGSELATFSSAEHQGDTYGAALVPDGRILTALGPVDGYSLFALDGTETVVLPGMLTSVADTDVMPGGQLVVVDQSGQVDTFTVDGTHLEAYGAGVLLHPWGVHADAESTLWVTDLTTDQLHRFGEDGTLLLTIDLGYAAGDVVRAPDGTLWVVSMWTGALNQYAPDGTLLQTHPTVISSFASGLGLAADGSLLVADFYSPEVHRYAPDGTLLETIPQPSAGAGGVMFITVVGDPGGIGDSYCGPANLNSTGGPAVIEATGSAQVAFGFVQLHATELPPNQFGYFLNSMTQGFVPFPGGSQGNLCLGGSIGRYVADVANTGAAGELHLTLDLANTPTPNGPVSIQPGETWNFQCWFRDNNPGPTSNFTDGVSIAFQ